MPTKKRIGFTVRSYLHFLAVISEESLHAVPSNTNNFRQIYLTYRWDLKVTNTQGQGESKSNGHEELLHIQSEVQNWNLTIRWNLVSPPIHSFLEGVLLLCRGCSHFILRLTNRARSPRCWILRMYNQYLFFKIFLIISLCCFLVSGKTLACWIHYLCISFFSGMGSNLFLEPLQLYPRPDWFWISSWVNLRRLDIC